MVDAPCTHWTYSRLLRKPGSAAPFFPVLALQCLSMDPGLSGVPGPQTGITDGWEIVASVPVRSQHITPIVDCPPQVGSLQNLNVSTTL